ncbi:Glucose dehydrogenase [FAD, quinone] [Orchesella cincta]|uniref:Glucose dehydrogenase [FAD, quinone] n=1 Tax=Orchesella cincta TaxID=48709 RepID=A0A1D2N180_ORCCI|nr:Glucose dehydrogenase [FAD, quinone] [Orchesella cincta]
MGRFQLPPRLIAKLLVPTAIPMLVASFAMWMQFADVFYNFPFQKLDKSYDFIVVGAGSAGSAIAARLSEDPSVSVLLLESGGDPNPFSYIPAAVPYIAHELTEFPYTTVPQVNSAFGIINQSIPWPRGRGLGGSSNGNFMIYNRGNPRDYNRWAQISGDNRWSWENVLKFFLKMEDYYGYWDGNGFHSKGGPVRIEPVRYTPGMDYVLAAGEEIGLPSRDANTVVQTPGISPMDFNQKRGYRFSTYRAYILPNEKRPNFRILRYSQVVKINFDDEFRAIRVTFLRHEARQYVEASKEIIISAGTIGSPQLLMLSGIGPKEHLQELGIKPLLNLPVGDGLQDHVTTYVGPFLLNKKRVSYIQERDMNLGAVMNYIKDGSGPISTPMQATLFGLVSTSFTDPSWSDIFWSMQNVGVHGALGDSLDVLFSTKGKIFRRYLKPHLGQEGHYIIQSLGLPKSVGNLRLSDANPNSLPIIDPKYYSDPKGQDINAMLEGIQVLLRLYENTTSLGGELGAHLSPRHIPGCEQHLHRSRGYWECVIRTVTGTLYHPSSTCAMGKRGDPKTVVDSQLRVIRTKGLRVADSSIMPMVVK